MYQQIKKSFEDKGEFEVINWNPSNSQLRITGRVSPKNASSWKHTMQALLSDAKGWKVDISRFYFLRNDQLFYAWRLIFQGNLSKHEKAIAAILRKTHSPIPEEMDLMEYEIPIHRPAVSWKNGKGGFPLGTQPLIFSRPSIT